MDAKITQSHTPHRRLLRLPEVLARVGLSRSEWYRRVSLGLAPAPVPIGVRARAWVDADIEAYIDGLVAERSARNGGGR